MFLLHPKEAPTDCIFLYTMHGWPPDLCGHAVVKVCGFVSFQESQLAVGQGFI